MGLLYVFPISEEEQGFALKQDEGLLLKTYGLPYLFWIYAICSIAVIFFMFLAIKAPVLKLIALGDATDATLGYSLLGFIGCLPFFILMFFFYEKRIFKRRNDLSLEHRLLGIKLYSEKLILEDTDEFSIDSFLSAPNVARIRARDDSTGFQNKGYFVLWLKNKSGKKKLIDRHSRKVDLDRLKSLLLKY